MNLKNCRKCGRIFNYVLGPYVCQACKEEMDKKFQEVKEYIREHKGVGIHEVAEVCEVEVSQIHQWLREERLQLVEGSGIVLQCENCQSVIITGRYCGKCKKELVTGLRSVSEPVGQERQTSLEKMREKERLRFLENTSE